MLTRTGITIREIDITAPQRRGDRPEGRDGPGKNVHDGIDIAIRLDEDGQTTDASAPTTAPARIPLGASVEVLCRFDDRWTAGFTVVDVAGHGYRLRRRSDGSVLPAWFPQDQIRLDPVG